MFYSAPSTSKSKILQCCIAIFLMFLTASVAQAGFLSTLSKLGKAGKQGDLDAPDLRGNLPEGISADEIATIRLNNSGQWEVHGENGARSPINSTPSKPTPKSHKAVVLDAFFLPNDLDAFLSIPPHLPVFIRTKHDRLFELHRPENNLESDITQSWRIQDRAVSMKVDDIKALRNAIWHLEKPIIAGSPRLLSVEAAPSTHKQDLAKDATGRIIHPIDTKASEVLDSFSQMKRETVVLAGQLDQHQLRFSADHSLDLKVLKQAAESNDINLVLLDTPTPKKALDRLALQLTMRDSKDTFVGTFFNQYVAGIPSSNKGYHSSPVIELEPSDSGNSQVLVQWQASEHQYNANSSSNFYDSSTTKNKSNEAWITHFALHSTLHSIKVFHPDEARSDELESRIIPWLHSFIQIYLIASAFLGFMAIVTSWRAWNWLWKPQRPKRWHGWLLYAVTWSIHKVLFLIVFLPIAGFFTFWYIVLSTVWKISYYLVNRLLLRPIYWLSSKMIRP